MKPFADGLLRGHVTGQADIRGVVAGLRFEQAAIEFLQLRIGHMVAQDRKPLTAAGLDQPGHQQPVDRSGRLLLADDCVEPLAVARRRQLSEGDAPSFEQIEHELKMRQLLVDDLRHRAGQWDVIDIGKKQVHRHACRLLFAVRVVDEDVVEVGVDLGEPAGAGGGLQAEHGSVDGGAE